MTSRSPRAVRRVAVVDHGMGNIRSVAKALEAAGASVTVTADRDALARSEALCVPGQGIFGRCMINLKEGGLDRAITEWVADGRPYLGICLGMQVLFGSSAEAGGTPGLGIFAGEVERLPHTVRVPHIGWNTAGGTYFYFDHSFAVQPRDGSVVKHWTEHGRRFASWIEAGSVTGVQFHPEKSSAAGIELLKGWLADDGAS